MSDNEEIEAYLPLDYPCVSGIIANISKGLVWADHTHMPGIYVAYSYCVGGCGIVGDLTDYSDEEVKSFFERVFADFRSEGENSFEFSSENKELYARILHLFKEKKIDTEIEYSFIGKNKCEEQIMMYLMMELIFHLQTIVLIWLYQDMRYIIFRI